MTPFLIMIVLQLVIAAIVVFVLKNLLDRELEKAAIEKMMSLRTDTDTKMINIYYANLLPLRVEEEFRDLVKNKFVNSEIMFERLESIKGGLIIKLENEVLDFSLSSRLENFWS